MEHDFHHLQALPELMKMNEELDALGGGDARVGACTVCCRVASPAEGERSQAGVVHLDKGYVMVRDPRSAEDMPADQAIRRYKVGRAFRAEEDLDGGLAFQHVGEEVVAWLLDGFNATLLATGPSGTGKTSSLFGSGVAAPAAAAAAAAAVGSFRPLVARLLQACLAALDEAQDEQLGVSAWELQPDGTCLDLLAPGAAAPAAASPPRPQSRVPLPAVPGAELQHCVVRVASYAEAAALLHQALRSSSSWVAARTAQLLAPVPGQAHLFLRLVLYRPALRQLTTLHIVDLAGGPPLLAPRCAGPADADAEQRSRTKRAVAQQLLSFSRLVSELARRLAPQPGAAPGAAAAAAAAGRRLATARDSALSQQLAPLLAGNCRTWMLACVSDAAAAYLDTINALRVATRAQAICTPCHRMQGLLDNALDAQLLPLSCVLPWRSVVAIQEANAGTAAAPAGGLAPQPAVPAGASEAPSTAGRQHASLGKLPGMRPEASPAAVAAAAAAARPPARPAQEEEGQEHSWEDILRCSRQSLLQPPSPDDMRPRREPRLDGCAAHAAVGHRQQQQEKGEEARAGLAAGTPPPDGTDGADALSIQEQLSMLKRRFHHIVEQTPVPDSCYAGRSVLVPDPEPPWQQQTPASQQLDAPAPPHSRPASQQAQQQQQPPPPPPLQPHQQPGSAGRAAAAAAAGDGLQNLSPNVLQAAFGQTRPLTPEEQLRAGNDTLLSILDREKSGAEVLRERLQQVEAELFENTTTYEVKMDSLRLELLREKQRCRKLQSGCELAEVLDDYERLVARLQDDRRWLENENAELLYRYQLQEALMLPDEQGVHGKEEEQQKLQRLAKSLRRAERERAELQAQVEELQKAERIHRVHRRQAEAGVKRVAQVEQQLAECQDRIVRHSLAHAEVDGRREALEAELDLTKQQCERQQQQLQQLQDECRRQQQQLQQLSQQRRREVVVANLPPLKHHWAAGTAPGTTASSAGPSGRRRKGGLPAALQEGCRQLRMQVPPGPQVNALLDTIHRGIQNVLEDVGVMRRREEMLLAMLTGSHGLPALDGPLSQHVERPARIPAA